MLVVALDHARLTLTTSHLCIQFIKLLDSLRSTTELNQRAHIQAAPVDLPLISKSSPLSTVNILAQRVNSLLNQKLTCGER